MERNEVVFSLFENLNRENVRYAVLRNYELLPESCGSSDLDIWIKNADYGKYLSVLAKVCEETGAKLVSYKNDRFCPQFTLCTHLFGLQIDVYNGLAAHCAVSYVDETLIEGNIFDYNGVKVLKPELDGLMSFLKETLNNKRCKKDYCEKAYHAILGKSDDEILNMLKAFTPKVAQKILETLRERKFDDESIKNLGKAASKDLLSIGARIKYACVQIKKIKRFFQPLGYTIAVLGTDGSGKSTIINAITPTLEEAFHKGVNYEHMRPNYLPSLGVLTGRREKTAEPQVCSDPHGSKPSGFLGSLARLAYYLADYTWGYFRKIYADKSIKNHVWIFDRYYYDYANDPLRARICLPKWILKVGGWFVPKPDLTLCLGSDARVIHKRKPELPLEEVRRQVAQLRRYADREKRAVWIDTGCSIEESRDAAMGAVLEMMEKRFNWVLPKQF